MILVRVDLSYADYKKEKTKNFPCRPEKKISPQDKFSKLMKNKKPSTFTRNKKMICGLTDKTN